MSEVEMYNIAKVAREKLLSEYSFKNHNMRRLVAHANLYVYVLDAYHKQGQKTPEKPRTDTQSSPNRRVTSSAPSRSEVPALQGGRRETTEPNGNKPKPASAQKVGTLPSNPIALGDFEDLNVLNGSTEVMVVEVMLEEDA